VVERSQGSPGNWIPIMTNATYSAQLFMTNSAGFFRIRN